jgi:hypothetical protein
MYTPNVSSNFIGYTAASPSAAVSSPITTYASGAYAANTSYQVKPAVSWTAGTYCTQTNTFNVNSGCTPTKLAITLQIGKMFLTSGSVIMIDNITLTECTAAVSTTTGTASYVQGSGPSAEQSFSVSGSDLLANLRLTAGSNMEISTTSGSGFASSLDLTESSGTVGSTTIYARLKAGLSVGTYNGDTEKISVVSSSSVNTITPKYVQFTGTVDVATALSQITGAKLTTSNGTISIDGLAAGELVDVYDSMGKKVKSAIADGSNLKIAINAKGVYVVKIKSFSQKVVL